MILDLQHFFVGNEGYKEISAEFDFSNLELFGVFPITHPVKITGKVLSKTGIVSMNANLLFDYTAPCDKCCELTTNSYDVDIKKVLVMSLENEEEADDVLILPSGKLDLYDMVRQEIMLSLPYRHLCSDECMGLCPQCGVNLNIESCKCSDS